MRDYRIVEMLQQDLTRSDCGPYALKFVLSVYGHEFNINYLKKLTKTSKKDGAKAEDLINAVAECGFFGKISDNQSMKKLEKEIEKGPVIVNWYEPKFNVGHYSVAVKTTKHFIYLADSITGGIRKVKKENFEKRWFDFLGDFYPENPKDLIKKRMIVLKPAENN